MSITNPREITPIEKHGNVLFKREDYFEVNGVKGSKAKGCYLLCEEAIVNGYDTITTAGSRHSPQINIASHIGSHLGLKVVAHTPTGKLHGEVLSAQENGAEIIQHSPGYNSVIIKRCKDYANDNGAFYVPFGMDCQEAINATAKQVANIKDYQDDIKRIVICVGSGINLSGLLVGLKEHNINIPVVGVIVGKDPIPTLKKYAPIEWETMCTLFKSPLKYENKAEYTNINGVELDEIYEGKCIPYIEQGDLMWVIGIRKEHEKGKQLNC